MHRASCGPPFFVGVFLSLLLLIWVVLVFLYIYIDRAFALLLVAGAGPNGGGEVVFGLMAARCSGGSVDHSVERGRGENTQPS